MIKHARVIGFFSLAIILVLFVALGHELYRSGVSVLTEKAKATSVIVADQYVEKEFQKLDLCFYYNPSPQVKSKHQHLSIKGILDGAVIDIDKTKEESAISNSMEERMKYNIVKRLSFYSSSCLDSLWRIELAQRGITARTALRITFINNDVKENISVSNDSTLCVASHNIKNYYAGIGSEINIETFIHFSFYSAIMHGSLSSSSILFAFLFLSFSSSVLFYMYRMKNWAVSKSLPATVVLVDENRSCVDNTIRILDTGFYQIGDLIFDSNMRKLTVNGQPFPVRQQSCSLLLLFLKEETHSLTNQQIIEELWGEREFKIEMRVQKAVSNLRKLLQVCDFPIQIEYEIDRYRLFLKNEE